MNKHRTKRIALKWIDVDEKIVPLVDWLNGFDSVHTEFSCQGDDKGDDPYVLFKCRHDGDLATILEAFEAFGEGRPFIRTEVCLDHAGDGLRYATRFFSRNIMLKFCSFLSDSEAFV